MKQPYMLPIIHCQYHACWCPGDLRSWGIEKHGIDQMIRNNPALASKELRTGNINTKIKAQQAQQTESIFNVGT